MKTIYIGDKEFKVETVNKPEAMATGLSKHKSLEQGHGMLFGFGKEQKVTMNMYDMDFPLDMLFIDGNGVVIHQETMHPGKHDVSVDDVKYVLEVNSGEGVNLLGETLSRKPKEGNMLVASKNVSEKMQAGGTFQMYEDEVKASVGDMQVLDDTGKVLMNIKGGERIFSIKHTEDLMKLAKKVKDGRLEPEALGRYMKKVIDMQDTQKPEYVD